MRTRKAVSIEKNPAQPDSTLLWYSRAIGVMRTKRKFVDPTSWRFQGAIHDYDESTDPYVDANDPAPAASVLKKYGRQCQHASWFFLPWHRMYLYLFEQIVADAVVEAGGPADWALPYWDYSADEKARKLPWAFGQPTWPGGEKNHLYVAERAPGINDGTTALSPVDVDTAPALGLERFSTDPASSDVQFGGPRVKNHGGGGPESPPFGGVESGPHNHVHVAVGGESGFMTDPTLAALDPIFWLHHANIDRLWEVWLQQAVHVNPAEKGWLTGQAFPFHDAKGKPVTMTSSEVVDIKKLGYVYEGVAPMQPMTESTPLPRARRPSLLGATAKSFSVVRAAHHVTIPTPAAGTESVHESVHDRVLLHIEHITARDSPGSYDVYVNVPASKDEAHFPRRRAGRISLFGARQTRRTTQSHTREGFNFVLDISEIYRTLSAAGEWDPARLGVTLKPVYEWSDKVTVGRVSVSVA